MDSLNRTLMLETLQEMLAHQFEAVFCTLNTCVERCPEESWDAPVANLAFCQVTFHTLFFTDFYLGQNEDLLRRQKFHRDHADFFRDYEELQDRPQQLFYDRQGVRIYLEHCRSKASEVIAAETEEALTAPCGFRRKEFSRAELHALNIRHIQHHTAQLSLRLRLDHDQDIPWVGSGWRGMME